MVVEIIIKYWLELLLGLIATGLGIACKKIYNLYKSEKQHQRSEDAKEFYSKLEGLIKAGRQESRQENIALQDELNNRIDSLEKKLDVLQNGVLSVQRKNFGQDCHTLLQENHEITIKEFEDLQAEYDTYKSLGGNHNGDVLYDMVVKKAANNLSN